MIDVGTNSVKLRVAERHGDDWTAVVDRAEVTRLGEGVLARGAIASVAAARTADAIASMAEEASREHVRAIAAIGTAGLRAATNRDEVLATIRERSGLDVEVISGDEEGRLAYLAVRSGLPDAEGPLVVFDTGGGSSQFTFGEGDRVRERFSVLVGSAGCAEAFGLDEAVPESVIEEARAAIGADLERLRAHQANERLVGMGGAVTNMTAVMLELDPYDADRVQGATLSVEEVDRQIERYRSTHADDRRSIVGLQRNRAEVILAGACIARTVMDVLRADALTVSDRGLRHGVFLDRFSQTEV
ncbi:MAG TPA: Ppx/GppA family phosphatase [Actinomycetota bacterium]|nr:Ppx/GppA family phosphatase [Actinomycetota bacterium]